MSRNRAQTERGYFLTSFAPSSGVGFYESNGRVHKFDLVTDEDETLEEDELLLQLMEVGQTRFDANFEGLENLKKFSEGEYLRDKKNAYYTVLFTRKLDAEARGKTLRLLDAPEFRELTISAGIIPPLRAAAKRGLVRLTLAQASELELKNVEACLRTELGEVVKAADSRTPARVAVTWARGAGEQALDWSLDGLRALRDFIETVIQTVRDALANFPPSKNALFPNLSEALREDVLGIRFTLGPNSRHYALLSDFYAAYYENDFDRLRRAVLALREQVTPQIGNLDIAGNEVIERAPAWNIWSNESTFNKRHLYFDFSFEPAEQWERRGRPTFGERFFESVKVLAGRNVLGRSADGTPFLSQFIFTERLLETHNEGSDYVQNLAFWAAYYAQPERMSEATRPYWRDGDYRFFLEGVLSRLYTMYDHSYSGQIGKIEELYPLYRTANVMAFFLLRSRDVYPLAELVYRHRVRGLGRHRRPGVTDPLIVFLNNLLIHSLQSRYEERLRQPIHIDAEGTSFERMIVEELDEIGAEPEELSPFIRVVL